MNMEIKYKGKSNHFLYKKSFYLNLNLTRLNI